MTVGRSTDPQKPDQGVLTERGGGISIFAADSINVGTSRIFTLRGGNETIWSTWGDIAAGSGSKTVFSAPPTRVLIDPQSGDVQNDLAGLATGSGIGVLATLAGVKPGDVDLIAPVGTVDAGDAGIRASGNLNVAARVVLNAANIQVGGVSVGTPPPPAPPNLAPLSAASAANAASSSAAADVAKRGAPPAQAIELPSLISVEVLGYGGGDAGDEEDEKRDANAGGATEK
ncbi:MAG: filamentous hemagglutinin family protein [Lacunisphaera sp.]